MNLQSRLLSALAGLSMLFVCGSLIPGRSDDIESQSVSIPADLKYLATGFNVRTVRSMPGPITSLLSKLEDDGLGENVYVGTGGSSGVYRLYAGNGGFMLSTLTIAFGLGDAAAHTTCEVNRLALRDLDHDGKEELIAETSQIAPRGRPRVYVWSGKPSPTLRAFARPSIESSWGHGMGFVRHEDSDSIISTYCGFGEIVEYRLNDSIQSDGYHDQSMGWRIIGRLPASGECVDVTDVDNDGIADVCIATGYANNEAAIHVYDLIENGILESPKIVIDEDKRFGTVKFIVGNVVPDGTRELFVWWCAGLGDGYTEFTRYRLGSYGVMLRERISSGPSSEIWPIDGQMTITDLDGDGTSEVWFTTATGNLYRYDPAHHSGLFLACQISVGLGPVASGGITAKPCLYLGSGSSLLKFTSSDGAPH